LYASTNIIRVIKSRRMRWTRNAVGMGGTRNAYIFLLERLKGRNRRKWEYNIKVNVRGNTV
jgi:hypothetical protein